MKASFRKVIAYATLGALPFFAACSTPKPVVETRIVEVASSKPYKFITWTPADSKETKAQVRAHNRAHQAVIDAEAKARVELAGRN